MGDILTVEHLTKQFGRLRAVDALSFEVREGEILGVMGPNGAGKTTVFNLLTGVSKPDEGTITFQGKDITHESPAKRCRIADRRNAFLESSLPHPPRGGDQGERFVCRGDGYNLWASGACW